MSYLCTVTKAPTQAAGAYHIIFEPNGGTLTGPSRIAVNGFDSITLPNVEKVGYTAKWRLSANNGEWRVPISTATELANITGNLDYVLANDLDLSSFSGNWTPISGFSGRLYSNGFSITGSVTISPDSNGYAGLFGSISTYSQFCDIKLSNLYVTISGANSCYSAGMLVGCSKNVSFSNCVVENCSLTVPNGTSYAGFLTGDSDDDSFTACEVNYSSINSSSSSCVTGILAGLATDPYTSTSFGPCTFTGCTGATALFGEEVSSTASTSFVDMRIGDNYCPIQYHTASRGRDVSTSHNPALYAPETSVWTLSEDQNIGDVVQVPHAEHSYYIFTAIYTANTYTIKYNSNGATGGSMSNSNILFGAGSKISANQFTRDGYTFLGWSLSSTAIVATYSNRCSIDTIAVGANNNNTTVNLYAVWQSNNINITFDTSGATTAGTANITVSRSGTMPNITAPTRTGYIFCGYYTSANGGGTQYYTASGASTKTCDFTSDTTLYAKWTPITYTINYNSNGGTGTMAASSHTYDVAKNLTANSFTRTGYTFHGWATSANGAKVYNNRASVSNLTTTNGGTVNLFAVWQAVTVTLTLDNQSATAAGTASVSVTYGAAIPSISPPTCTGYKFNGYFIATNGGGTKIYNANGSPAISTSTFASGATLYAYWTLDTYRVIFDDSGFENMVGALVGGFENTGWSNGVYDTTHVRSGQYSYKIAATSAMPEKTVSATQAVALDATTQNHTFYAQYWGYQETTSGSQSTQIYWPIEEPSFGQIALGTAGQWNMYSYYATRSNNALTGSMSLRIDYDNNSIDGTLWVDDFLLLDLTEIFGAGKEPTKAWCDANIRTGVSTQEITQGTATALTAHPATNVLTGISFAGWATSPRAGFATQTVAYADGQSVNSLADAGATKVLYAVWKPNDYTITLKSNDTAAEGILIGAGAHPYG